MSVDNLTRIDNGLDELVTSRYALKVGDIDVLIISDGVLPITASTMATNAEPAEYSAWLKDMFLPPEILDWPLNVAVVRSAGRTILIDSGLGTEFPDFPRAGQLGMRLSAAGVEPSSVTDVVLTHLHMDHIGGLLVDGLRNKLRKDLRVHVATAEAEFWQSPDFPAPSCRPRYHPCCDGPPPSSSTSTGANCAHSRTSMRWHRESCCGAPADTPPGTASCVSNPAARR